MPLPSKEERVLELFFNEPSKHWHFKYIVKTAKISEPAANKWLKKFLKQKLIKRIKPKGKMPYFQGDYPHDNYCNAKKIYALNKMHKSGLLTELQSLKKAKTVIIFGSYIRSDWHTDSDIDVFIYGDPEITFFEGYWSGLGFKGRARRISVHSYPTLKKIRDIQSGLMKNVVKGYFVKGNIYDIADVDV